MNLFHIVTVLVKRVTMLEIVIACKDKQIKYADKAVEIKEEYTSNLEALIESQRETINAQTRLLEIYTPFYVANQIKHLILTQPTICEGFYIFDGKTYELPIDENGIQLDAEIIAASLETTVDVVENVLPHIYH